MRGFAEAIWAPTALKKAFGRWELASHPDELPYETKQSKERPTMKTLRVQVEYPRPATEETIERIFVILRNAYLYFSCHMSPKVDEFHVALDHNPADVNWQDVVGGLLDLDANVIIKKT